MSTLTDFLTSWDSSYKNEVQTIDLFDISKTKLLSQNQKKYFALIFYHARGHFHDFLWYLGNHSLDKETKDIVLKNIAEELNGSARSHEQLYLSFAESLGADVLKESIEEKNYLPFLRNFNKDHILWLNDNDDKIRFASFSAYERLDNLDYINLENFAKSINISSKNRLFFTVHTRVEHFETTSSKLNYIWQIEPKKVEKGFEFIATHQIKMWKDLSRELFSYNA